MSAFNPSSLMPAVFAVVIAALYYRRIRRQFGRQPYQHTRVMFRLAVLTLAACGLVWAAVVLPHVALGVAIGLAAGAICGALALHHTRIESADGAQWYTPHPLFGVLLSALLIGRLAWRWSQGAFTAGGPTTAQNASPMTLGIVAALVGFYLVSVGGLAWRMRVLSRAGSA